MKGKWFFPVGLVLGVFASLWISREPSEPLTRTALDEARALWQREGPADYLLVVEVGGAQEVEHRLEVRAGEVASMTSGGEPAPEHVWTYWTVDGLFRFLATELANAEDPQAAFGVDSSSAVRLRAGFDPELGLPRRFVRHVEGRPLATDWTVTDFRPLP